MRVRKRSTKVSLLSAVLVAVMSMVLAACGSDSDGPPGADDGDMTTVKVGVLPITSLAPVRLGVEKGFFEEEGLKLELEVAQSGAALVPAVVSGQYEFGYSNTLSLVLGHGKGLPLRIVRSANSAGSEPEPSQEALVVAEDSGITSVKQLEGKTIALNSLNNTPHISVLATLEKAGVNTDSVDFVEAGYPDMALALSEGRFDAAQIVEPFLTDVLKKGFVDLAHPYRDFEPDQHIASWFTTQDYIDSNPEVVDAFARAVDKSNAYARENSEEVREIVPTYLDIDPQLAQDMALAGFPEGTPDVAQLERLAAAAEKYGFVEKAPENLDEVIADID